MNHHEIHLQGDFTNDLSRTCEKYLRSKPILAPMVAYFNGENVAFLEWVIHEHRVRSAHSMDTCARFPA